VAGLIAAAALLVCLEQVRSPILRSVAHALVVDEAVSAADVVVISFPTSAMGVFEAADLVEAGMARSVALFREDSDSVQGEFARRGVAYPSGPEIAAHQLELLGISNILEIPFVVQGTEDQGDALRAWLDQQRFGSVIVVTVPDHSRRLRRVLDRAMGQTPTKVAVRVTRHSDYDPDRWWQTRDGIRTTIVEAQKLTLDVIRHPLP
jgi:hypothetical protein